VYPSAGWYSSLVDTRCALASGGRPCGDLRGVWIRAGIPAHGILVGLALSFLSRPCGSVIEIRDPEMSLCSLFLFPCGVVPCSFPGLAASNSGILRGLRD
jgi:hypothetical protein